MMKNKPPDAERTHQLTNFDMDAEAALDPKIQAAIGRSLKAHFDELVSAPVPDRFLALLAELEAKEQRHGR